MLVFTQVSSMKTRRAAIDPALMCLPAARACGRRQDGLFAGETVFFEAQPLGVDEHPYRPIVNLDAPLGQLGDQPPQREARPRHRARSQSA